MKSKVDPLIDFEILKNFGFSKNEIHAFLCILRLGTCEVREICQQTFIPTSKIYNILNKLENFGLIEIEKIRPKKCKAININLIIERLRDLKFKEYENFKNKLPEFQEFLEKRIVKFDDSSTFWHVAINENQIIKKHISRFKFVNFVGEICIDYDVIEMLNKRYKIASDIITNFKNKRIITKLLIGYQGEKEKKAILEWLKYLPPKKNEKNEFRLINQFIQKPFGLIDLDKTILFIRHPVRTNQFISSIYMIDKSLHDELANLFLVLWKQGEIINLK
ncbi:MAG: TrmB family transcriptional regulator [Promethearchaeota archaeon]